MWTEFYDMSSGGFKKLFHHIVLIEAPEAEALSVFYRRFQHNPHNCTCACCGPDYWVRQYETLADAAAWNGSPDVPSFLARPEVLAIPASDIQPEERRVDVPKPYYPAEVY